MKITCKVCKEYYYDRFYNNAWCLKFGHEIDPEMSSCKDAIYIDPFYYKIKESLKHED